MILYFAWSHVRSLQTDNDANDIAIDRIKGIYSKKGLFLSPPSDKLKGFLILHISRYSVLFRLHISENVIALEIVKTQSKAQRLNVFHIKFPLCFIL